MAGISPDMAMLEYRDRQSMGKQGAGLHVITNAFKATSPKRAELFFFDCNIVLAGAREDSKIRKDQNRRLILQVIQQMQTAFGLGSKTLLFAYDDEKTLVLVNVKIPMRVHDKKDFHIEQGGPRMPNGQAVAMNYTITLTFTKTLNISDADFRVMDRGQQNDKEVRGTIERLQALNLLLREAISDVNRLPSMATSRIVVSMGDKIYANLTEQTFPKDVGRYRAIWPGFAAAFRVSRCGLVLNADLTHSVFFNEGHLSHIVCAMMNIRLDQNARLDKTQGMRMGLGTVLRSRLVDFQTFDGTESDQPGLLGKIFYRGADEQFMSDEDQTTLQQAYAKHNVNLDYPRLGCIEVICGNATFRVPIEKCFLRGGQRFNRLLDKQEQATFIRAVSLGPDKRISEIADFMKLSGVRTHQLMTEIGLQIAEEFVQIGGRVLRNPDIEYVQNGQMCKLTPVDGQWTMGRSMNYKEPSKMPKYLVLIFPSRRGGPCMNQNAVSAFIQQMGREAVNRGMTWGQCLEVYNVEQPPDRLMQEMEQCIKHYVPGFVFGVFDRGMDRQYSDWKAIMDNHLGIPSQGLLTQTVERSPRGCHDNILYKVNTKLGGNNNTLTDEALGQLKLLHRMFMVLGISLSHGRTKDEESKPSYAGFVASVDDSFRNWISEVMVTDANEAVLAQISEKIMRLLQAYKANCGKFPELLIVYRDGVTRTQESELLRNDLKCIREAFRRLNITVELIFIVVNKMHRQRFFRAPQKNTMGELMYSKENVPAGLVVDDDIVDPYGDDFYLASHRGMLGTSRPIRYHILVNEDSMQTDADDIQGLTMALCYVYQRCTLGVSIPAPLYYANLAAARSAVLADSVIRENEGAMRGGGGGGRGRGGPMRGGRGRGGGRGAPPVSILSVPGMRERLEQGISQHETLREGMRLSYI